MKKYRITGSEHFNLLSMYDHLKCIEIDMREAPAHTYTEDEWDSFYKKLDEVEDLLEIAKCVGAYVDWKTLKRIREIKEERQMIRYAKCLSQGTPEHEAALAFQL